MSIEQARKDVEAMRARGATSLAINARFRKEYTWHREIDGPERAVAPGYTAARAMGRAAFEIDLPAATRAGQHSADTGWPILKDGSTASTGQVGICDLLPDGRGLLRFSRSESGRAAEAAFATKQAAVSVATRTDANGQDRPVALTLRTREQSRKDEGAQNMEAQEIARLGAKYGQDAIATQAIAEGKTLEAFRSQLLDANATGPLDAPAIHTAGHRQCNLGSAIRAEITGDWSKAGFERETTQEARASYPGTARGLVVPPSVVLGQRAAMTSTGAAAGAIETNLQPSMYIDSLRAASSVMAAGATVMSGLDRGVVIPKQATDATAYWLAEGAAATESAIDVDSISLNLKRVSGTQTFTREALLQSQPAIDEIVRRSITTQLMQAIDLAGLEGTGANNQPTGVANTSGVNTLTAAGAALTRAEALNALAAIEGDNIPTDNAVWIFHPTDYARTAHYTQDAGSGRFVIENGELQGRRVIQTTKATQGTAYLGVWENLLIGQFGGVDLIVDPYSEAKAAKVGITAHMMADVAVRHAQAFNVITLTQA